MPIAGSKTEVRQGGHRFWTFFTIGVLLITSMLMARWIFTHPYPVGWDEASYINRAYKDFYAFEDRGILGLAKALLVHQRTKPPAYRLAILPVSLTIGPKPILLRFSSVLLFMFSVCLIYRTVALLSGHSAGCLAVALVTTCESVVQTCTRFYTEPTLFIAMSATLYFLAREAVGKTNGVIGFLGLSCALALGALAKLSYLVVISPALLIFGISLVFGSHKDLSRARFLKACAFSVLFVSPFYALNILRYIAYAKYAASDWVGHSLQASSHFGYTLTWLDLLRKTGGYVVTSFLAIVITSLVLRLIRQRKLGLNKQQAIMLIGCLSGAMLFFAFHFTGNNQNPRFLTHAFFPMIAALAILSQKLSLTRGFPALLLAVIISTQPVGQLWPLVGPNLFGAYPKPTSRPNQYDWDRFYNFVTPRFSENPRIAYLGLGSTYNRAQIAYPWVRRNQRVLVKQLYSSSQGDIKWDEIFQIIDDMDIVLTIPNYSGWNDRDNLYNEIFAKKLVGDTRFMEPVTVSLSDHKDETVLVFFHKFNESS